jgi:predicted RNase H-like HicB family nuclease
MIQTFLLNYLSKAKYEIIDDGKKFYAQIPSLRGVWATGNTLEECRENLVSTLEGWLIFRLRNNLSVPNLKVPKKLTLPKTYA